MSEYTIGEFKELIKNRLEEDPVALGLPEEYKNAEYFIKHVTKAGVKYDGLIILPESSGNEIKCAPTHNLDYYYDLYCFDGCTVDDILQDIVNTQMNMNNPEFIGMSPYDIYDYEKIRDRLGIRFCNRDKNKEMLRDIPHSNIAGDIAAYVYVNCEIANTGSDGEVERESGCITVNTAILENMGIDFGELFQAALAQTMDKMPPRVYDMFDSGMLIVTAGEGDLLTGEHLYGATACLYPGFLKSVAEDLGMDSFYLLPSSIHELILIAEDPSGPSTSVLKEMIRSVNAQAVDSADFLSDELFHYDKGADLFEEIGEYKARMKALKADKGKKTVKRSHI